MAVFTATAAALGTTAATVAAGTAAVGAGISAYGQYQSGKAQEAMAKYNAQVARQQADAESMAIAERGRRLAREQRELRGEQQAAVGLTGGMLEGGDLLALADQAAQMSLDQLELKRQSDIAQLGGESKAQQSLYEGRVARYTSKIGAAGTFLQGVGTAYNLSQAYKLQSPTGGTDPLKGIDSSMGSINLGDAPRIA